MRHMKMKGMALMALGVFTLIFGILDAGIVLMLMGIGVYRAKEEDLEW